MMKDKGGRPAKYDWDKIRNAYESGISIVDICETFDLKKKTLQNKISDGKWKVSGSYEADIQGFKEASLKVSGYFGNSPEIDDIVSDRVQTVLEDNEIIGNNRKLLKALQHEMAVGIKSGEYKTPQNIKAGASTVRDMESISNPSATASRVSIQQNTVVTTGEAVADAIRRKFNS